MAGPRQSLLIVDDEQDILIALRAYLANALPGVEVHVAGSGPAALDVLRSQPIDLVLSDFKMPGMDGLELLAKAQAVRPVAARLLMTAFPDMDLAIRALNEGRIQHFLTKPLDPDMVREVLKALLDEGLARSHREAALRRSLETMRQRAKGT